jgi:hypothetical protein
VGWRAREYKLYTPAPNTAARPPTFLIRTWLAEVPDDLDDASVIALEVVTLFLRHTPLYVIVDTLKYSVCDPASKTSN